jgi:hypothetical protein
MEPAGPAALTRAGEDSGPRELDGPLELAISVAMLLRAAVPEEATDRRSASE